MRRSIFSGRWLLLALLCVGPTVRVSGQDVNNAGALFLALPVGAAAVGMGQTAVTLEGRGEAAFWNPAGLATLSANEFALESASLAAGTTHALTAYFRSHGVGVIGGALYLLDYGDLDRTDSTSATIARISPRNFEFLASYALPARLVVGALYRVALRGDAAGPADDRIDVKVAADVDSPWGSYGESQMRFGVDIGYQRLLRVRGGYAFVRDGLSGPSVGMGVATGAIGVDFARTFLSSADFVADNPTFVSF